MKILNCFKNIKRVSQNIIKQTKEWQSGIDSMIQILKLMKKNISEHGR